jgi:hypothetical protein
MKICAIRVLWSQTWKWWYPRQFCLWEVFDILERLAVFEKTRHGDKVMDIWFGKLKEKTHIINNDKRLLLYKYFFLCW